MFSKLQFSKFKEFVPSQFFARFNLLKYHEICPKEIFVVVVLSIVWSIEKTFRIDIKISIYLKIKNTNFQKNSFSTKPGFSSSHYLAFKKKNKANQLFWHEVLKKNQDLPKSHLRKLKKMSCFNYRAFEALRKYPRMSTFSTLFVFRLFLV